MSEAQMERVLSPREKEEILNRKDQIRELREELRELETEIKEVEASEADLEPEHGEEVIYDAVAPQLEEDLRTLRVESGTQISLLWTEIERIAKGGL